MLGNPGTYANKKRKKPVLKQKKLSVGNDVVKSNPSKRHRDRLNGELDTLTDLLPFSEDVRTRLDKLSVLRLSVGYLRVKSYFKATIKNSASSPAFPGLNGQNGNTADNAGFTEGDMLLQALNGFVMVVTSEGLVFYASPTIKDYLGFHESDVVHQSVFDLIHTDDRDIFRQQLHFALNPPPVSVNKDGSQSCGNTVVYSPEQLPPENSSFLERNFVCRFRCLLDNSSGFLALTFQGRLKYIHGQSFLRDNRTCTTPQLALFTIAVPVQPPAIVEIRAKMLLFQTKHKLDFTPTGIDSRGKMVLGYSETELCMKGSGYQFIHAADMMHCADNHLRMIKTGETGLTVFRLLNKSNGWIWVKSNARLIYKAGRPEFIIAYQKALVNAEGEEYLRQRRLQLPFSFATGEAILYNTGPTVDVTLFQFNKMFNSDVSQDVTPGSLLDCFLRQDETAYTQTVEPPLPMDQVFMDSRALVSVASDAWQKNGPTANAAGDSAVVKNEAKQSVIAVINDLEKMAQSGDFTTVLQNLEVDNVELAEWENALKRLGQDADQQNSVSSELDSILTNDIFDYIDSFLFQEKRDDGLSVCHPGPALSCSPKNGLYAHQQDTEQILIESAQIFNGTQELSHQGLPPVQELQLQDIFSPTIELPGLVLPDASANDALAPFQSISHMGCPPGIAAQTLAGRVPPRCEPAMQAPALAVTGPMLQNSRKPANNVAPGLIDILPPMIPCNHLSSPTTPNIPFASGRLQGSSPFETHQVQQWPQSQRQKLAHCGIAQGINEPVPPCNGQTSGSQTLPNNGLWPRSVARVNHTQQGGLACGQAATHRSCMFDLHFASSPAEGDVLAVSGSSALRQADASLGQGPLQGSCFFQWGGGEPEVGPSSIGPQNGNVTGPTEHALNIQHYQGNNRWTQDGRLPADLNGIFATPHDAAMYLPE